MSGVGLLTGLLTGGSKSVREHVCDTGGLLGEDVCVDLQGDRRVCVSQAISHHVDWLSREQQCRRVGVPQVM